MSIFKTLFKDTFIYGVAMVLPKLISLLLNGLYTDVLETDQYSEITSFYVYVGFINVLLTYGMETAFFRFYNKSKNKEAVYTTALISLLISVFTFLIFVFIFRVNIANLFKLTVPILLMLIGLVAFDILVVIPFAYYRLKGKAIAYAGIRIFTLVIVNGFLNLFFLKLVDRYEFPLPNLLIFEAKETYVFLANFIANALMLILVLPNYFRFRWKFDSAVFKQMQSYGFPILIAGFAFLIIENIDKLILRDMLGKDIMGAYSACYKFGVFLMLFIQAFRMGIEPFFFSQADKQNAKSSYAVVLKFFVIFASLGILTVLTFQDLFTSIIIKDDSYLKAIKIVPIILLANWCLGVYQSLSVWYKVTDKTKYGMYFTILGASITLVINYTLIPTLGFIAAAYATLVAYASMMIASYFLGQRHYKIPYDVPRLFIYLLIALFFSGLNLYVLPKFIIMKITMILLYLLVIVIFEKNSFKRLLKN